MNKAFIQDGICYVNEVEQMLSEETSNVAMNIHLSKLSKLIETLMHMTYESQDQDDKAALATLELRARKCLDVIKSNLAVNG